MSHSPVRYAVTVDTPSDLGLFTEGFDPGDVALVRLSPPTEFVFSSRTDLPADDVNVIASVEGSWIVPYYAERAGGTWHVRGQTGSDVTGDGSLTKPYQTISRVIQALGPAPVVLRGDVTIDVGSEDLQTTDAPVFFGIVGEGGSIPTIYINGTLTAIASGIVLDAVQASVIASNQDPQIASSSVALWDSYATAILRIDASAIPAHIGLLSSVAESLGSTARVGEWHSTNASKKGTTVTLSAAAVGDTISVLSAPNFPRGVQAIRCNAYFSFTNVKLSEAVDGDIYFDQNTSSWTMFFNDCIISGHGRWRGGAYGPIFNGGFVHHFDSVYGAARYNAVVHNGVSGSFLHWQGSMYIGTNDGAAGVAASAGPTPSILGDSWFFHAHATAGFIQATGSSRIEVSLSGGYVAGNTKFASGANGGPVYNLASSVVSTIIHISDTAKTICTLSPTEILILSTPYTIAGLTAGSAKGLFSDSLQSGITVGTSAFNAIP